MFVQIQYTDIYIFGQEIFHVLTYLEFNFSGN